MTAPPEGDEWAFEIKYDGYRLEATIDAGTVRLWTRRANDWTARFPDVALALSKLPVQSAVLDGELVALDQAGRSNFGRLQRSLDASSECDLTYFVFDMLQRDGHDLRMLSLSERRECLDRLLGPQATTGPLRLGQRLEGGGQALIVAACQLGLEGIIGKRLDGPYRSGRGTGWIKVKCGHRQEFVVVGFTPPAGSRVGIGSLLLAVYQLGALHYAGRVGSGIPTTELVTLRKRLAPSARKSSPLSQVPPGLPRSITWVDPKMVVEVSFTEWTSDGRLRHPVFQGVREDKSTREIRREHPNMTVTRTKQSKRRTTARRTEGASAKPGSRVKRRTKRHQSSAADAVVDGVAISHPDRVVFPEAGITKLELARHFERIGSLMLPHVAGRPLSLVRCPEGSGAECFFQKHWTGRQPPSIGSAPVRQSDGRTRAQVMVHDVEGLVTLAQWGVIEVHPWGARADRLERPDRIVFDLDPGPGVQWKQVTEAAAGLRELLETLGLASWLKTSGGKGLHVELAIARRSTWDDVSEFSRAVAEHLQAEFPDRFISKASKAAREGLIFVDWLRNTRGATSIAPWSTRARPRAGVSVPVPWNRLSSLSSGDQFTLLTIRDHPPNATDPWDGMLHASQVLSRSMLRRLGR